MNIDEQIRKAARDELRRLLDTALFAGGVQVYVSGGDASFHNMQGRECWDYGPKVGIDSAEIPPDVRALMRLRELL